MTGGKTKGKADAKFSVKKSAAKGKRPVKKGKAAKDPHMRKRSTTSFFVFMEEFRKTYQEKHPHNKSVAAACKAGGEKWRSMTDAEKKPFQDIAYKRKLEFLKERHAYNKRLAKGTPEDEDQIRG